MIEPNSLTLQALINTLLNEENGSKPQQNLATIIAALPLVSSIVDMPFCQIGLDSRQIATGDVFVLLKSQTPHCRHSRDYIVTAAQKAAFILTEVDPVSLFTAPNVPVHTNLQLKDPQSQDVQASLLGLPCPIVYVPTIRNFLGDLLQACLQYHQSVDLPTVVAVTGTNGKTTISQLVAQLAQLSGMSSAVMGTAGNGKLGALVQASHTTADAVAVQRFLYQMGQENADLLVLEASSHGLDQQRLQGMPVTVAVYTNLSRDHLDYHADMTAYATAKARLFDKTIFPTLTHAIINIDDAYAPIMIDRAKASHLTIWTYTLQATKSATFVASRIVPSLQGVEIRLHSDFGDVNIVSPLLGRFNVANLLAAVAATVALGLDFDRIIAAIPHLQGAVGRMQRVPSNDGCFIVDYAHTPDALTQVLDSLKTHCQGQLWAVFGCGGDRDAGKRPLMAQAGLLGADQVVLTADNPRTEDPVAILTDMQAGMSPEQYERLHIEPSRQKAIKYAVDHASPNDIVVIAGKGHETYQEINQVRHDFDDCVVLLQALQQTGRA